MSVETPIANGIHGLADRVSTLERKLASTSTGMEPAWQARPGSVKSGMYVRHDEYPLDLFIVMGGGDGAWTLKSFCYPNVTKTNAPNSVLSLASPLETNLASVIATTRGDYDRVQATVDSALDAKAEVKLWSDAYTTAFGYKPERAAIGLMATKVEDIRIRAGDSERKVRELQAKIDSLQEEHNRLVCERDQAVNVAARRKEALYDIKQTVQGII